MEPVTDLECTVLVHFVFSSDSNDESLLTRRTNDSERAQKKTQRIKNFEDLCLAQKWSMIV